MGILKKSIFILLQTTNWWLIFSFFFLKPKHMYGELCWYRTKIGQIECGSYHRIAIISLTIIWNWNWRIHLLASCQTNGDLNRSTAVAMDKSNPTDPMIVIMKALSKGNKCVSNSTRLQTHFNEMWSSFVPICNCESAELWVEFHFCCCLFFLFFASAKSVNSLGSGCEFWVRAQMSRMHTLTYIRNVPSDVCRSIGAIAVHAQNYRE